MALLNASVIGLWGQLRPFRAMLGGEIAKVVRSDCILTIIQPFTGVAV